MKSTRPVGTTRPISHDRDESAKLLRILIIEDNETDFLLLSRQIKIALAEISCARAENRHQLLQILPQPWHLIVTDFHLPDIEEGELINTITAAHPETPCLVLSGSIEHMRSLAMPDNVVGCIEKGDRAALRQALTRCAGLPP